MRNRLAFALMFSWVVTPCASLAHQSIVPDQFPTIQAAINANTIGYSDTIYVRDGDYPEVLTPHSDLWLITLPTVSTSPASPSLGMARVRSIVGLSGRLLVRGFRFKEAVSFVGAGRGEFEGCWFDDGLSVRAGSSGHVWNCIVMGSRGLDLDGGTTMQVAMTTVIGGSIVENPPGGVSIQDNVVIGSGAPTGPTTGIYCASDLSAFRNYVRGYATGIYSYWEASAVVDNVVEDCSGAGIKALRGYGGSYGITGNTVRRSGRGIEITGSAISIGTVSQNRIESSVNEGIVFLGNFSGGTLQGNTVLSAGARGIEVSSPLTNVLGNRVVGAHGDGLVLTTGGGTVSDNIVGHSNGRGIVAGSVGQLRRNTSYLNAGAGFDVGGGASASIDHNIAHANTDAGLRWSGVPPIMGCNDWFGNLGGNLSGVSAGATDVTLDPLFCNPSIDNVELQAGSPLAALAGCGQVGALGVGCATVGVAPGTTTAIETLALSATPNPAPGQVLFAWTSPARGSELAVFDVTGQRRWARTVADMRGELLWRGLADDGRPLAAGIYFVRLTAGGRTTTRRITLSR